MATKRLIDANALVVEELLVMDRDYIDTFVSGVRKVMNAIRRLPIVDAVEVVHGRWIEEIEKNEVFESEMVKCSVCGQLRFFESNYCPNCGADMRERKDDDKNS